MKVCLNCKYREKLQHQDPCKRCMENVRILGQGYYWKERSNAE